MVLSFTGAVKLRPYVDIRAGVSNFKTKPLDFFDILWILIFTLNITIKCDPQVWPAPQIVSSPPECFQNPLNATCVTLKYQCNVSTQPKGIYGEFF